MLAAFQPDQPEIMAALRLPRLGLQGIKHVLGIIQYVNHAVAVTVVGFLGGAGRQPDLKMPGQRLTVDQARRQTLRGVARDGTQPE